MPNPDDDKCKSSISLCRFNRDLPDTIAILDIASTLFTRSFSIFGVVLSSLAWRWLTRDHPTAAAFVVLNADGLPPSPTLNDSQSCSSFQDSVAFSLSSWVRLMAEATSRGSVNSEEYPRSSYGNACMNCARSKTKCTASRIGAKCERYQRSRTRTRTRTCSARNNSE
jgi:hypothetical protein